jgi:hypothetical protein
MRVEALKTGHSGPALLITWTIRFLPFPSSYLPDRQLCLQVCAWLSQELRHGVLNVVGQARLQEASWLAQSARHRSDVASANRNLLELVALAAKTGPLTMQSTATPNASFMDILQLDHRLRQLIFYTRRRRDLSIEFRISDQGLLDHTTGPKPWPPVSFAISFLAQRRSRNVAPISVFLSPERFAPNTLQYLRLIAWRDVISKLGSRAARCGHGSPRGPGPSTRDGYAG